MELLEIIIMVIGFIGLGVYQHYKTKNLKDQIDYQKGILESVKIYVDIFQPEKLKDYVKISEETFKIERDREFEKYLKVVTHLLDPQILEHKKDTTRLVNFLSREYKAALELLFRLLLFVSPDNRKLAIEKLPDSISKEILMKSMDEISYAGDIRLNVAAEMLYKSQLAKSQIEDKQKSS